MDFNLYTFEQTINYRVKEQQRLAEQLRKVSEATANQNNKQQNRQLNKTSRKSNLLGLLSR